MRAVLSGGVAMLLGATAACATESTSLRGSAGKAVTEAKEAKTLDGQLADVFHNATKGFNASGVLIPNATKGFNASGHFIPSATNGFNASGPLTTVPRSEQMAKTEALVAKPGLENETNLAAAHYGGYGPPVPLPPHYGGGGYGPPGLPPHGGGGYGLPPQPPHGGGGYGPPPSPPHYGGGGYGPPPHGGGGYGPPPPPPPHYGGGGHGAHACIGRFCVAVNGRASSVVTEAEEAKTLHGQLADRIAPTATEGLHASGPAIPNATTGFNASGPLTTVLRSEPMAKKEALVAKPGLDNETNLAAAHGPPVPLPPHYGGGTQLFPPQGGGGYGLPPQPPHYGGGGCGMWPQPPHCGGGGYGSPVPSHVPPLPHGGGWGGSTRGGGWGGSAHGGGYGGSGWQVR